MVRFKIKDNVDLYKKLNLIAGFFVFKFSYDKVYKYHNYLNDYDKILILTFHTDDIFIKNYVYGEIKKTKKNTYLKVYIDFHNTQESYLSKILYYDLERFIKNNYKDVTAVFFNKLNVDFCFTIIDSKKEKTAKDIEKFIKKVEKVFKLKFDIDSDVRNINISISCNLIVKITIKYDVFTYNENLKIEYIPLLEIIELKQDYNNLILRNM